ncbi:DUF167 domain-containing protein [Candidatus Uhrbacteria bacterium]|nr:DUF167 domain-containing protein [Candidatus Uhrbacteria bacterium]
MRISVKAKPQAFEEKIEKLPDGSLVVFVKEPPINGQANRAIQRVLAQHFGVTRDRVRIVSGYTSRNKLIEIS